MTWPALLMPLARQYVSPGRAPRSLTRPLSQRTAWPNRERLPSSAQPTTWPPVVDPGRPGVIAAGRAQVREGEAQRRRVRQRPPRSPFWRAGWGRRELPGNDADSSQRQAQRCQKAHTRRKGARCLRQGRQSPPQRLITRPQAQRRTGQGRRREPKQQPPILRRGRARPAQRLGVAGLLARQMVLADRPPGGREKEQQRLGQ